MSAAVLARRPHLMPFHYVLADLLAKVPGAVAVVFIDDTGETIDVATTGYSPEELKIFGAYFGIGLGQARLLLENAQLGAPVSIHLRHEKTSVDAICLPDGYFLVMLRSSPALAGLARRHMRRAVADLERELFS